MVETVFLDWGLCFGAGVLFAIAGRDEVRSAPSRIRTRAFAWGLLYLHAGILSVSLTLYALNRDWMWMYWVDARTLPAGIQVLSFAVYELCFLAGFFLAAELARKAAWGIAGAAFVAISTLEVTARTRLFHFGTLEQFRAGRAPLGITLHPFAVRAEWWVAFGLGSLSLLAIIATLVALSRRTAHGRSGRGSTQGVDYSAASL